MVRVIVAFCLVFASANHVSAAASGGTIPGGVIAGVSFGSPPTSTSTNPSSCVWSRWIPADNGLSQDAPVSKVIDGRFYWLYARRCGERYDVVWIPEMTSRDLGTQSSAETRRLLPTPQWSSAPPRDRGVVNLSMWFWLPPAVWQPVEATAWVPTDNGVLWATTRAVPVSMRFDPGDGHSGGGPVTCQGPGPVWHPGDGDHTSSPCSATYRHASAMARKGPYIATLTVTWQTSWTSSTGAGGVLEPLVSTYSAPVDIHEIHALVSR